MIRHLHLGSVVPAIVALTLGSGIACRNTAEGVRKDAEEASQASTGAREEAKGVASDVQRAAATAADVAAESAEHAAERMAAAAEGIDVKTALMADPSVDAARIDVNTDPDARIIRLEGAVPSEAERDMAGIIAAGHAPGYRIENRLAVAPKS